MKGKVLLMITERINENRFQKLRLRPFVESDKLRNSELDRVIGELENLYDLVNALREY
jgi:hypothetical protein